MTAAARKNRHTASLECLWEKYFERNTVRAGGRYLGNDMDCHLFTTGAGLRAGLHFLAFAVASVTMLAILLATRRLRPLALRDHLFCVLQGCCVFCFNFWCFYTAAAHINTGLESVIFSMAVLFNAINGFLFFRQQPPARFWLAAALGLVGIVTLFWDDLLSNGLNVLAVGNWSQRAGNLRFSLGNMLSMRHQRRGLETLTTNSWAMLYGTLVMGAIALVRGDDFTPVDAELYGRAAVPGAVRIGDCVRRLLYAGWRIGASKAAYSTLLFPLVALTISTFYEGYVWHSNAVIGLALILVGTW
jgi:drug/metabolite transporter (DMT)-like permease